MPHNDDIEHGSAKWVRRGRYCLVMGLGAFFVYFNAIYGWLEAPRYLRLSDFWFDPLWARLEPYGPLLVIVIGIGFLAYACYCGYRYIVTKKRAR